VTSRGLGIAGTAHPREEGVEFSRKGHDTGVSRFGAQVSALASRLEARSVLDYGCGSQRELLGCLNLDPLTVYEGYDPEVPAFRADPCPAELVVCVDFLRHGDPELLENALDHLARLCDPHGFFVIPAGPASAEPSDRRGAEPTRPDWPWWKARITERFSIIEIGSTAGGSFVVVRARSRQVLLAPNYQEDHGGREPEVADARGPVITDAYREEQARLHATGGYGRMGSTFGPRVSELASRLKARSLLDYGCGSRRSLLETLMLEPSVAYEGYDPAVPAYAANPRPAGLVVCIDVLEHIESNLLDNVLDHLAELCDPHGFFTVHTGPAVKFLSDGRNAHLTQQDWPWWKPRLAKRFSLVEAGPTRGGFFVVVRSLRT
jgi:Methyltransferase domain